MEQKKIKDIVKEELLGNFDYIINNKDGYADNDVFRIRFLKNNIDEVVSIILANRASYLAFNNDDYRNALMEYGTEFAMLVKERIMQEEYKNFGYDEKLPTLEEKKMMLRRHEDNIKYLYSHGASDDYIEIIKLENQKELDLFYCMRGELSNQFGGSSIVKISQDVVNFNDDKIALARKGYIRARKK